MTGMDTATAADPSADALIAAATSHHRDGRLAEAEKLYRQILAIAPRHAETLYHLGIIGLQTGRPLVAIEAIGEAVKIDSVRKTPYAGLYEVRVGGEIRYTDESGS